MNERLRAYSNIDAPIVKRVQEMTDRKYALEVADWIERELAKAKTTGETETLRRPYIQNTDLIIKALREYGNKT